MMGEAGEGEGETTADSVLLATCGGAWLHPGRHRLTPGSPPPAARLVQRGRTPLALAEDHRRYDVALLLASSRHHHHPLLDRGDADVLHS